MDLQSFLASPCPAPGFEAFRPAPWNESLGEARTWQLALHLGDDDIWATWAWSSTSGTRIDRLLLITSAVITLVEPWSISSARHEALQLIRTRENELLLGLQPPLSKELSLPITDWQAGPTVDLLQALYQARRP